MANVEQHIAAPPDRVFALMSDFASSPQRIPGITKVEMLTNGPVGVGTKFKETRVMFGKEATETMWVTSYDPPRSYTLGANSCGMEYAFNIRCIPDSGGTRVVMEFDGKPITFFSRIMAPIAKLMMGPMIKKSLRKDLESIKRFAETDRGAT